MRLHARSGAHGQELLSILERLRAEDPAEPFWKGVRRLHAGEDQLEIEWNEPVEPRLVPAGRVQVECHLYDERALAPQAEAAAAPVRLVPASE